MGAGTRPTPRRRAGGRPESIARASLRRMFDAGYLFASMCVSGVGFVLLSYGKSQRRFPHMAMGLVLLVYPYFVSSVGLMLAIGAALMGLLALVVRLGM